MLLIQDSRSIDIMKEYGNGGKDGEVELWLNRDQVEQVVPLTDIVIVCILLPSMPTLCKSILFLR
jgi:hypothetical protein